MQWATEHVLSFLRFYRDYFIPTTTFHNSCVEGKAGAPDTDLVQSDGSVFLLSEFIALVKLYQSQDG